MGRILPVLCIAAAGTLLAGCMTMYDGKTQKIKIRTEPSEAMIRVEESRTKTTVATDTSPMEINLERKHSYHVKISKEGYQPATVGIWRQTNDVVWINLGLLPFHPPGTALALISALFDHLSGAIWDLEPSDINVTLEPVGTAKEEKPPPAAEKSRLPPEGEVSPKVDNGGQ